MSSKHKQKSVVVSREAFESDDPYEIIQSNIDFVNALFGEHLTQAEVSENALRSYYVDYFLAEFNNGGFSQFVYNSGWGKCIDLITSGFAEMGAVKHLAQFEAAAQQMSARPGIDGLKIFFASDYFDENEERDILDEFNDSFVSLSEEENLVELNARWLRQLPDLVVLSEQEMAEELKMRANAIPDREQRIAAALAAEPRYMKVIRALCKEAGHDFDRVTAGDPTFEYEGEQMISWHFLTNQGHFHMADINGKALMFRGHTKEVVCEIDVPEE